jgi:flagellin
MSFRINTNIPGMIAHRNASTSGSSLQESISRLSSGMRINTAGDDPAGLIASEGLRAQIASIESASRNNQDAINFSKTAEAALAEVNKLLSDARALAITAGNSATLSASQNQANQDQLVSIASSVTRIALNTQFGTRRLLDGSSGVQAQISDASRIQGMSFAGTFAGTPITSNGLVSVSVSTQATRASFSSATLTGGVVLNAGSVNINGTSFSFPTGTTGAAVVASINSSSSQTGVTANFNATSNVITLSSSKYGASQAINFTDPSGVISAAGTNVAPTGTNAIATASISVNGSTRTAIFTGGKNATDGLALSDADGNVVRLTEFGNTNLGVTTTVGQVAAGVASFQIGANVNQTAQLSLPNLTASNLGNDILGNVNLSTIDLSTATGASQAIQVIDRAIEQVSASRGRIGQFTKYILDSNNRSLAAARENMAATESAIRDVDMASEMTQFTKFQVMQQAGTAILAQANNLPQNVLSLVRGN